MKQTLIDQGKEYTYKELAEIAGISPQTLHQRIKYGMPVEEAVHKPLQNQNHGSCHAKTIKDCFSCQFDDCVRSINRKRLIGEYSVDTFLRGSAFE